ncbi:hypothetical protein D3C75_749600 [compost metagenome]
MLEDHGYRVGFRATPGCGNCGARDRLRKNLLSEIKERLVRFFNVRYGFFTFVGGTRQQSREFWQFVVVFQAFKIVKNRLFN